MASCWYGSQLPQAYNKKRPEHKAYLEYLDQHLWDVYYKGAYLKVVTSFATWSPAASCNPYTIYGNECPSGTVIDPTCAQGAPGPVGHEASTLWNNCKSCATGGSRAVCTVPLVLEERGSHCAPR